MAPPYFLLHFLLPLLTVVPFTRATSQISPPVSLPGCRNKCGNITVPYPFGFEPNCFREGFSLMCDESYNPPQLFISVYGYEITDISPKGEMHISVMAKRACYNSNGDYISGSGLSTCIALYQSPYLFSVSNSFYVLGCPYQGYFADANGYYISGCVSVCPPPIYSLGSTNGSCTGVGCGQSSIPNGLSFYQASFQNLQFSRQGTDSTIFANPTNCSYAFLADSNWFHFDNSYLKRTSDFKVQVRLDWAVRYMGNCSYARRNMTNFACRSLSHDCYNSDNGAGYLCNCSEGYQGNPYITDGCQDINECELKKEYPCYGVCTNTIGGYNCTCPRGTEGAPYLKNGCRKKNNFPLGVVLGMTITIGFSLAMAILLSYFAIVKRIKLFEKRKQEKLKQKFFVQNRGLLLQQLIASHEDATQNMRILRLHDLEKATNRFNNALIIGQGGHGEVYKGILSDQRVVAIKRSKIVDPSEIDQFINEVVILSQVNHRNIVKLYGCCLETEVPLLAYEFISNGTLFNHLHVEEHCSLTWKHRLRIALEVAGAISYLHSSASISVFHRDIKSSNILLDDYFTAKVSDFGASRSVQIDQTGITTAVQGTHGYLDPEYYCTGRLSHKSDVYSFGVILAELLTRERPLFSSRKFEGGSLIAYFSSSMEENRLFEILDPQVVNEGKRIEIEAVAKLAKMCLRMKGEERPTMKEVEVRLDVLWQSNQQQEHPWRSQRLEERQLMLPDYIAGIDTTVQCRFEQELELSSFLSVNDPRSI